MTIEYSLFNQYSIGGITIVVETGRVRYTRHGYRCRKCGFNFRFDLTSPVSKCPNCGSVINDKLAYYFCRIGRGFGCAVLVALPLILIEMFYLPKTFPLITLIAVLLFTCLLSYKQMWTLILSRVTLRVSLVLIVMMLVCVLIEWVLGALNIVKPDNGMAVIAGLVVGLVLSAISLVLFKVKSDTFDYVDPNQ